MKYIYLVMYGVPNCELEDVEVEAFSTIKDAQAFLAEEVENKLTDIKLAHKPEFETVTYYKHTKNEVIFSYCGEQFNIRVINAVINEN